MLPDAPVTAVSWDSSTDDIICAFGPAHSTIEIVRVKVLRLPYMCWEY